MKNKIILLIMMFILLIPGVYAEESDIYKIEIPEAYEKEEIDETQNLYTLNTKDYTISVLIYTVKNSDDLNISKYESKDVKHQEEAFKENMMKEYKEKEITAEIRSLSGTIEKVNSYDAVIMDIETKYTFDKNVSTIYQKQYLFSSKNYLYYVIVSTSSKEVLTNEETKKIMSSFEIKDELYEKDKGIMDKILTSVKENPILYGVVGVLIVSTLVTSVVTRNKKEK